jgi:hypothetical protein
VRHRWGGTSSSKKTPKSVGEVPSPRHFRGLVNRRRNHNTANAMAIKRDQARSRPFRVISPHGRESAHPRRFCQRGMPCSGMRTSIRALRFGLSRVSVGFSSESGAAFRAPSRPAGRQHASAIQSCSPQIASNPLSVARLRSDAIRRSPAQRTDPSHPPVSSARYRRRFAPQFRTSGTWVAQLTVAHHAECDRRCVPPR